MLPVYVLESFIGPITIHWEDSGKVDAIDLPRPLSGDDVVVPLDEVPAPARQVVEELREYFAGQRRTFSAEPLVFPGNTPFKRAVYEYVFTIPAGETRSYGKVAAAAGYPRAARAVGTTMATNTLPIVIPCHRVVAGNGPGGYGGCLDRKLALLRHEGASLHF